MPPNQHVDKLERQQCVAASFTVNSQGRKLSKTPKVQLLNSVLYHLTGTLKKTPSPWNMYSLCESWVSNILLINIDYLHYQTIYIFPSPALNHWGRAFEGHFVSSSSSEGVWSLISWHNTTPRLMTIQNEKRAMESVS